MSVILRRRKLGNTSCREIAAAMAMPVQVHRNDKVFPGRWLGNYLFRWGCTSNVPNDYIIVNQSKAIHLVSDKTAFRKLLAEAELCTRTRFDIDDVDHHQWRAGFFNGETVIVRPRNHAQGRNLYHCKSYEELEAAVERCGDGYYINEYIEKVAEYRVFVAQGRAVWVAQKTPGNPEDIAWNVAKGGRFDNVRWDDWPLRVIKAAIEGFNLSGLDFGGVDVMVDAEGKPYILEINSAPSQTSPYRQSCVAKVFDYIIQNGKAAIPLTQERGGYRKFIHPAVCNNAIVVGDA